MNVFSYHKQTLYHSALITCHNPTPRCSAIRCSAPSSSSPEYDFVSKSTLIPTFGTEAEISGSTLLPTTAAETSVIICLSHCADLGSPELVQRLLKDNIVRELQSAGVKVFLITLGSQGNARAFKMLFGEEAFEDLPLYVDTDGSLYRSMGFSRGFAPDNDAISPYIRLLAMLSGLGSAGTLREVFRGYVGDQDSPQVFKSGTMLGDAFNVLGQGHQRPLELATLRLQNMMSSLTHWGKLAPSDPKLLTWLGGCLIFKGHQLVWRYDDRGILQTVNAQDILEQVARQ